jgi:hypothetical protein
VSLNKTASINSTRAPSFFAGASHTDASRASFAAVSGDQYNVYNINHTNELLNTLKPVDHGGYYVLPCMEGTRQDIFEKVDHWLSDINGPNILWINGSPGSGKSAIASSLVTMLSSRGLLGSSFAFKRGDAALGDPTALWRTVAYDLARHNDTFARKVVEVLERRLVDPGRPDIASHFKYLIKEPLNSSFTRTTPIIVIDALDECGSEPSQAGQRRMLIGTITQWPSLPGQYKLIITGRNDRVPDTFRAICREVTLPTGVEVDESANNDIRLFFETRFADFWDCLSPNLRRRHVFDTLVARAAGLFIWAETVVRFVEEGIHDERLQRVLSGRIGNGDDITKLYQQILALSFREADNYMLHTFNRVVAAIVLAKVPVHEDDLPQIIAQGNSSIMSILSKLSSVISIGTDRRYRINHLSFSEFLCDSNRCPKQFHIDRGEESRKLSMMCFRLMRDGLGFNICDLETSSLLNRDVDGLEQRIKAKVTGSLLYSCRFWASHFQDVVGNQCGDDALLIEVKEFFDVRLLYWLEVMSLTKELVAGNVALLTVARLIQVSHPLLAAAVYRRGVDILLVGF